MAKTLTHKMLKAAVELANDKELTAAQRLSALSIYIDLKGVKPENRGSRKNKAKGTSTADLARLLGTVKPAKTPTSEPDSKTPPADSVETS